MEALTCQVKFYGIDTDMLASFWFCQRQPFTLWLIRAISVTALRAVRLRKLRVCTDRHTRCAQWDTLSENAVTVDIAVGYYRQSLDGRELFAIDTERFARRVNGVDVLSGTAAKCVSDFTVIPPL